jgi:hypothetical protein
MTCNGSQYEAKMYYYSLEHTCVAVTYVFRQIKRCHQSTFFTTFVTYLTKDITVDINSYFCHISWDNPCKTSVWMTQRQYCCFQVDDTTMDGRSIHTVFHIHDDSTLVETQVKKLFLFCLSFSLLGTSVSRSGFYVEMYCVFINCL